jgi:hypothetical protein
MADEKRQPTERTPKGVEVPVPKRGQVFSNLDKIAKGGPPPERDSARRGGSKK